MIIAIHPSSCDFADLTHANINLIKNAYMSGKAVHSAEDVDILQKMKVKRRLTK